MNKQAKVIYTEEDLGKLKIIKDFLPSPTKLANRKKTTKTQRRLPEKEKHEP